MADIIEFPGRHNAAPHIPTEHNPVQPLHTAFASLLLAHHAPCGGQPSADQMDAIARASGVAVTAIMEALNAATQTHKEQRHQCLPATKPDDQQDRPLPPMDPAPSR